MTLDRKIYNCATGCPVESTLQLISGKWKSVLLYSLIFDGEQRYIELQKRIPGITRRMLSLQLKALEQDGLINRFVIQDKPLMVTYTISDYGLSLKPIVGLLCEWGKEFNKKNEGKLIEKNITS